jgi:CheY-like chemotaxis protein
MKALVIEDDAGTRLVLKRLLTRFFPHNVLEAADGEAGWTLLEQERPAVIFCDMYMPKLDGIEFLQRLRAHPELKETPLIAITSAQDPEVVRQLIQLGVADYLLKPIALEATVKRLTKVLPGLLAAAKRRAEESAAAVIASAGEPAMPPAPAESVTAATATTTGPAAADTAPSS